VRIHRERVIDVRFGTLPRRDRRAERLLRRAPCRSRPAAACAGVLYASLRRKA